MRRSFPLASFGCALALLSLGTGCSSLTEADPIQIAAEQIPPAHAAAPEPPAAPAPEPAAAPAAPAPASGG